MRVTCVDDIDLLYGCGLTAGKSYDVTSEYSEGYRVIDDGGNECGYLYSRFKSKSDMREQQLNNLGV
jgi:hypothetical protein